MEEVSFGNDGRVAFSENDLLGRLAFSKQGKWARRKDGEHKTSSPHLHAFTIKRQGPAEISFEELDSFRGNLNPLTCKGKRTLPDSGCQAQQSCRAATAAFGGCTHKQSFYELTLKCRREPNPKVAQVFLAAFSQHRACGRRRALLVPQD